MSKKREIEFRCKDDPEANGRTPQKGEQRSTFRNWWTTKTIEKNFSNGMYPRSCQEAYTALKAALDAPAENGEHEYLSTACYHAQHDRCRKECKFCSVACNCACHIDAPKPEDYYALADVEKAILDELKAARGMRDAENLAKRIRARLTQPEKQDRVLGGQP